MGQTDYRDRWRQLQVNAAQAGMTVEDHGADFWLVGNGQAIVFRHNTRGIRQAFGVLRNTRPGYLAEADQPPGWDLLKILTEHLAIPIRLQDVTFSLAFRKLLPPPAKDVEKKFHLDAEGVANAIRWLEDFEVEATLYQNNGK